MIAVIAVKQTRSIPTLWWWNQWFNLTSTIMSYSIRIHTTIQSPSEPSFPDVIGVIYIHGGTNRLSGQAEKARMSPNILLEYLLRYIRHMPDVMLDFWKVLPHENWTRDNGAGHWAGIVIILHTFCSVSRFYVTSRPLL
jgi:hypothetical protein